MASIAIIGGSGAALFPVHGDTQVPAQSNRWGEPSAGLNHWTTNGHDIYFLSRHGRTGRIPPHRINYRANIRLLADTGVERIIALNTVGAINARMAPGSLVLPDQLVDYTWGRDHSFFDGPDEPSLYIDFTMPYNEQLRQSLVSAAAAGLDLIVGGTYGATQGPRLETAAEINRMEFDGCDLVGMTGMPEAALAREAGLAYASLCISVNWAAGRSADSIHSDIELYQQQGITSAAALLQAWLARG